jgi:hypothetical protein
MTPSPRFQEGVGVKGQNRRRFLFLFFSVHAALIRLPAPSPASREK